MTSSKLVDIVQLQKALKIIADKRDWRKFHSPKNLVMALTGEVGELVEIFQWLTEQESALVMANESLSAAVKDEVADVLIYLAQLAAVLELDLDEAVQAKLKKNAEKYPALSSIEQADR
jgi:dCTP diphosphatase